MASLYPGSPATTQTRVSWGLAARIGAESVIARHNSYSLATSP